MDIPYERQQGSRTCGAAALCMVYRSFGMDCTQLTVWDAIRTPDSSGRDYTATDRMIRDALSRGFYAAAGRATDALHTLALCKDNSIRAILSHRVNRDSDLGHYTVLIDINDEAVIVHDPDPDRGPSRSIPRSDLLELWNPRPPQSGITGNILITIVNQLPPESRCSQCGQPSIPCPQCGNSTPLSPIPVLGCFRRQCRERIWEAVICAYCNAGLDIP